jgi:stress-induced morphogen
MRAPSASRRLALASSSAPPLFRRYPPYNLPRAPPAQLRASSSSPAAAPPPPPPPPSAAPTAASLERALRASSSLGLTPDCSVKVTDTSGGCGAFFDVLVVSSRFAGLAPLAQHRRVASALGAAVGAKHGLTIKTRAA